MSLPRTDQPQVEPSEVELVDASGRAIGRADKLVAHRSPGQLHRAVSILLLDADGRLIVQRRAPGKYHFAGLWANTCCGHPRPGEAPLAAARRRLREELGAGPDTSLTAAGILSYEADDPVSGLVEREFDHLYVGVLDQALHPDPAEVAELARWPLDEVVRSDMHDPEFAAWFGPVFRAAYPALLRLLPVVRT